MYELTIMLSVFLIVYLSCWWLNDGNEAIPASKLPTATSLRRTSQLHTQEQASSGD